MRNSSQVVMNLPNEHDIELTSELLLRDQPPLIRRQIHYKNGMSLEIQCDRAGRVYHVNLDSGKTRLLLLHDFIISVPKRE